MIGPDIGRLTGRDVAVIFGSSAGLIVLALVGLVGLAAVLHRMHILAAG